MNEIILYTIHCPACDVLEKKLRNKKIQFSIIDNIEVLKKLGIENFPVLSIDNKLYNFIESVNWINSQESNNNEC